MPATSVPPASATMSGTQCPAAYGGSSHSETNTRGEDVVERRGREVDHLDVERTDADDVLEAVCRDCAHVAELLGDDDVRVDARPGLLVDRIERLPVARRLRDRAVDFRARQLRGLDERGGDRGTLRRLRRP